MGGLLIFLGLTVLFVLSLGGLGCLILLLFMLKNPSDLINCCSLGMPFFFGCMFFTAGTLVHRTGFCYVVSVAYLVLFVFVFFRNQEMEACDLKAGSELMDIILTKVSSFLVF